MTPATTCPAASVSSDGHDTRMGFILYHRYRRIPENIQESLTEAAAATGINVSELRMRLTGTGIGALTVNRPLKELERCVDDLKAIGLTAAVIEKDLIKKSRLPAAAKKLHLSAASMAFEDANGETLFQINDQTDLLIIITDLSGQSVRQRMTAMTYTGTAVNSSFEESLKKISIARPAAIFHALNNPSVTGVYVDADIFSFMGLNEHLTCAKGTNFRIMINQAMALAKSCVMDENFGLSLLPGASPEWNSDKPAIEKELGRYARYIIAAAENRLLVKGSEIPGQEMINKGLDQEGSEADDITINNGNSASTENLKSPPDISDSRIVGFFHTSMPEIIAILIVLMSPFSMIITNVHSIEPDNRLWEIALGAGVLAAGFLMVFHGILLFYYRRMIENTPTSRIRSLSMGMVELSGKTRRYFDLKASATLTPCVFYRCRHYRYKKTGDSASWILTRSLTSGKIPFYIEDDTGRVLINPKGAVFDIPLTTQTFSGSFIPSLLLQLPDSETKVVEDLIPVGVRVYVLGSAQIERHGLDTRTRIIDKLRQLKQNPESLNRYDANGDGQIDGNEWEAARQDAATQVYAESLTDASANAETVVIEKPRFGLLPFIVADSEKGLVRQLMFRTFLFLAAGIITIGFSIRFMVSLIG